MTGEYEVIFKPEGISEMYLSYNNGERDHCVCRSSYQNDFGVIKVWAAIYEGSRQHRDFGSKKLTGRTIFFGRLVINERQRTLCGGGGDPWRSDDTL